MKNILIIILLCLSKCAFSQTLTQSDCGALTITMDGVTPVTNSYTASNPVLCSTPCDASFCDEYNLITTTSPFSRRKDAFIYILQKQQSDGSFETIIVKRTNKVSKTWYNLDPGIYRVLARVAETNNLPAVTLGNCQARGFAFTGYDNRFSNLQVVGAPALYMSLDQVYCPGDLITLDASNSIGVDNFVVTVCQRPFGVTDGPCIRWAGSGWQVGQNPTQVDLNAIWDHPWWNKNTYEVMLAAGNACSSWTAKSAYFNVGFPNAIAVHDIDECDGTTVLSFPIHDCYESFSWEYFGDGVQFSESISSTHYVLTITTDVADNSFQVEAQLSSGGKTHTYMETGNVPFTPSLPSETPEEIAQICNDFPYCVQLADTECLQELEVTFVSPGLNVQISGTLLCVEVVGDEFQHGVIQVRGIGASGEGPIRTWPISLHPECHGDGAPVDLRDHDAIIPSTKLANSSEALKISFWPNPFHEVINIEINNKNTIEPLSMVLYDSTGALHMSGLITAEQINLSTLSPGIYFLKIVNAQGDEVFTEKIIKS